MDNFGENIWDISTWTSDINWKDWYLHCYFDSLSFPDCIKQILDISETYFTSVFNHYNGDHDDEEGVVTAFEFPYLDILVLLSEGYIFGWYFHYVTPLQELQLLEILCRYFQDNKLDPIRYFVFDCLFGLPSENLDLQKGLMENKLHLMSKLTSLAIGARCSNVLNCIAVWFHTYGSQFGRGARVANAVVADYCYICPNAVSSIRDLIDVSPVFANQFVKAMSEYHKIQKREKKDGCHSIPHPLVIDIIANWVMEQPNFCLIKIPTVFLDLPSIHGFNGKHMSMHFKFCPLLSLLEWAILEPVYGGDNLSLEEQNKAKMPYSKLHYAFISFIASQKKFESRKYDSDSDSDDQEEGELLEDNEGVELFLKMDVIYLVQSLQEYFSNHKESTSETKVDETLQHKSTDRLIQVLQTARSSGCLSLAPRQLHNLLLDLPSTQLLKQVLKHLS